MATPTPKKTRKLTTFAWTGTDRGGKTVNGELDGPNPAYIRSSLRRQGIQPKSVKKKPSPLFDKKIIPKDVCVVTRQIATMVEAGIPIAQALNAVASSTDHPTLRIVLGAVRTDVEGGTNLSQALARYPKQFDRLFCGLIAIGEQSGNLDRMLNNLADYMERSEEIKAKVKGAMMYPVAVLVVGLLVSSLLLVFVVPQFKELFEGFGGELPGLTATIVAMSEFVQEKWWLVVGVATAIGIAFSLALKRSTAFQFAFDKFLLVAPVVGPLLTKASCARFARTMGIMFGSGVPMVEALTSVAGASPNSVFRRSCFSIQDEVSTGRPLSTAMEDTKLFPNLVLAMVSIGEESGELEKMLNKTADFFEAEVNDMVDNMSQLIEPIMISVLGGMVGTLVVAMYLPIFKMGSIM